MSMQPSIENIEIDLLLEAIYRRWGFDFRSYARASIERRTAQFERDITAQRKAGEKIKK